MIPWLSNLLIANTGQIITNSKSIEGMKLNLPNRTRQNQRYNYTPRYYKGKEQGNLYDFGTKIEKSRDTYNSNDFGNHWREARNSSRTRSNRGLNRTIIIIIFILVFLFLWLIDFDLSIFSKPR